MLRSIIAALFALALVAHGSPVAAQDSLQDPYGTPKPKAPVVKPPALPKTPTKPVSVPKVDPLDEAVAAALIARGNVLFNARDYANARQLFVEALVRSPNGPRAILALDMLKQANTKLGNKDVFSGAPKVLRPPNKDAPIDPYGTGTKTNPGDVKKTGEPIDPYADPKTAGSKIKDNTGEPLDPYATGKNDKPNLPAQKDDPGADRRARTMLIGWGGLLGLTVGLALGGPDDDSADGGGGGAALLGIVGAGATAGLAYYLTRKRKLTAGQSAAIMSAGTWGAYNIGLLTDTFKTQGTSTNDVFAGLAVGGVLGVAAGAAYALKYKPTQNEVAVINSFGGYGTLAGFMLGLAMDPPETEAYSVNGMLGSIGGLAVGMFAAKKLKVSRSRMLRVDLGAGLGTAAAWALFYPLISDDSTRSDEQTTGFVSVLSGIGGAYAAWYLTRKMDKKKKKSVLDAGVSSPYPSLLRRSSKGAWSKGIPLPRPIQNPALGPRTRGTSMGIDILSGWL